MDHEIFSLISDYPNSNVSKKAQIIKELCKTEIKDNKIYRILGDAFIDDNETVRKTVSRHSKKFNKSGINSIGNKVLNELKKLNKKLKICIETLIFLYSQEHITFNDELTLNFTKELSKIVKKESSFPTLFDQKEISNLAVSALKKLGIKEKDIALLQEQKIDVSKKIKNETDEKADEKKKEDQLIKQKIKKTKIILLTMLGIGCAALLIYMFIHIPLITSIIAAGAILIAFILSIFIYMCPDCRKLYSKKLIKKSGGTLKTNSVRVTNIYGITSSVSGRRLVHRYTYKCKSCGHIWHEMR